MDVRSSTASRALVCLVALLVCGAGTVGIVAAATGGSASLETDDGSLTETVDETDDGFENATNETTDEFENATNDTASETGNTTDETTDCLEETTNDTADELDESVTETTDEVNETTEEIDEASDETTDGLETTTDGTIDEVDETGDQTTDGIRNATDETTAEVDETINETDDGIDGTVSETVDTLENGTETATDTLDEAAHETVDAIDTVADETTDGVDTSSDAVDGSGELAGSGERTGSIESGTIDLEASASASTGSSDDTDDDDADDASATDSGGGGIGGVAAVPDGTSPATDAVLVGLLGTITAAGVAAGSASAAGGAAGASAGAGTGAAAGSAGAAGSAAGGAAAGGATGLANWLGRSSLLRYLRRAGSLVPWKLVPIFRYSRYDDSDPLENDRRRTIYETIADEPGCYLSEVSERSDVALSTVRHHVRVLEEEGLVAAAKVNGKRRYFLEDDGVAADDGDAIADVELHAALSEPAKREMLETLADLGSAPNGRLADELGRDPSTVSHHLSALEDDGLVVRERDGRSMVNELAPAVEAALREADPSLEDGSPTPSAPADD